MGVIRVKKEKNYTTMCNYHFREKTMSLKAKGLLSWMLSLPNDWDYSIKGMCECHKDGEDAITSALKELQIFGYLEVVKLLPGTIIENLDGSSYVLNRIDYDYVIHEKPINPQETKIQDDSFQDTDFQYTENSVTEFSASENPSQINTNQINTKKINTKKINTGTGVISKNRSFRSHQDKLEDILQSGKDIDEQKRDKKKLSEEEKANRRIDKTTYSDEIKNMLKQFFSNSYHSTSNRRMRHASDLDSRLTRLAKLISEGQDPIKVIQQSLDRGYHSFWEINNSITVDNHEVNQNSIKMRTLEEAKRDMEEKKKRGVPTF